MNGREPPPHARVTPVKNPMGRTLVSHVLRVMSLCFSSEMNPRPGPVDSHHAFSLNLAQLKARLREIRAFHWAVNCKEDELRRVIVVVV